MKFFSIVFFLCFVITSCAGRSSEESFVTMEIRGGGAAEAIVQNVIEKLALDYPPGHTAIQLIFPPKLDAFSRKFEALLRTKGFTISPNAPLCLAWRLDSIPESLLSGKDSEALLDDKKGENPKEKHNWYFRLTVANTKTFSTRILTRMYDKTGAPLAGFAEGRG